MQGVMQVNLKLNNQYEVTGYVKPGVGAELLTDTVKSEISKLTTADMIIFWGEVNDISHNASTKGLDQNFNY